MARGPIASLEFGVWIVYLLFSLLSELHSVREQPKLDMAPDAVDDSYKNCENKTLDYVTKTGGELMKEMEASRIFTKMWNMGKQFCKKQLPGGTNSHMIALHAYANSREFRKDFNSLVYSKGKNVTTYMKEFPLKSLHFLLMDAMRLANPQKRCTTVYYATKTMYTAENGKEVRFGKFISANKKKSEAEEEYTDEDFTLFNISSCSAVNLEDFTCKAEEVSFLISPNEVFTVVSSEKIDDDSSYINIMLNHSRFLSNQDCVLVSSPAVGLFLSSAPVLRFVLLALVCLHVVLI